MGKHKKDKKAIKKAIRDRLATSTQKEISPTEQLNQISYFLFKRLPHMFDPFGEETTAEVVIRLISAAYEPVSVTKPPPHMVDHVAEIAAQEKLDESPVDA